MAAAAQAAAAIGALTSQRANQELEAIREAREKLGEDITAAEERQLKKREQAAQRGAIRGFRISQAAAIAQAEADITLVNMVDEVSGQDAIDLRFVVSVRNLAHLEAVLKALRRTPSVTQARRVISTRHADAD